MQFCMAHLHIHTTLHRNQIARISMIVSVLVMLFTSLIGSGSHIILAASSLVYGRLIPPPVPGAWSPAAGLAIAHNLVRFSDLSAIGVAACLRAHQRPFV